MLDGALPGNEHADLPADAAGDLAKKRAQLGRDHLPRIDPPTVHALKGRKLGWLQARAIPGYFMHGTSGSRGGRTR